MSRQPDSQQVSNIWSCASLQDGIDHVMAECIPEEDEAALLKELEDSQLTVHACIYMASCTEHVINFIGMQVYIIYDILIQKYPKSCPVPKPLGQELNLQISEATPSAMSSVHCCSFKTLKNLSICIYINSWSVYLYVLLKVDGNQTLDIVNLHPARPK